MLTYEIKLSVKKKKRESITIEYRYSVSREQFFFSRICLKIQINLNNVCDDIEKGLRSNLKKKENYS